MLTNWASNNKNQKGKRGEEEEEILYWDSPKLTNKLVYHQSKTTTKSSVPRTFQTALYRLPQIFSQHYFLVSQIK